MADEKKEKRGRGKGSITAGFILVGMGLLFLLSNLNIIPDLEETWPLILIIVGAALLIGALRDKRTSDSMTPLPPSEPSPPAPIS